MGANSQNKQFFEHFINIRDMLKVTFCYSKSYYIDKQIDSKNEKSYNIYYV